MTYIDGLHLADSNFRAKVHCSCRFHFQCNCRFPLHLPMSMWLNPTLPDFRIRLNFITAHSILRDDFDKYAVIRLKGKICCHQTEGQNVLLGERKAFSRNVYFHFNYEMKTFVFANLHSTWQICLRFYLTESACLTY